MKREREKERKREREKERTVTSLLRSWGFEGRRMKRERETDRHTARQTDSPSRGMNVALRGKSGMEKKTGELETTAGRSGDTERTPDRLCCTSLPAGRT